MKKNKYHKNTIKDETERTSEIIFRISDKPKKDNSQDTRLSDLHEYYVTRTG